MNSRSQLQQADAGNSAGIRQEIQRFESVHPSIYAIYDLIELIPDHLLAAQIREHVVCIEDSFVNSQEWTLGRSVPDLRLGIVGALSSGKSALVHRYLTGSYMQEESPEGGRFKKEVVLDGHSYLLLIRDEGGVPEAQFTWWVDAVILVFSLENEGSFHAIYNYYAKMAHFRNMADIPVILVGTQDAISENNPRVIDDTRVRKLTSDLRRCLYYETGATYGLNIERVFQDACQRILQQRSLLAATPLQSSSRPPTPSGHLPPSPSARPLVPPASLVTATVYPHAVNGAGAAASPAHTHIHSHTLGAKAVDKDAAGTLKSEEATTLSRRHPTAPLPVPPSSSPPVFHALPAPNVGSNTMGPPPPPPGFESLLTTPKDQKDLPTPSSTPTTSRKSRRRSNLFAPSSKKGASTDDRGKGGEVGIGRAIPIKQGYLYKKSSKPLNKEWKKKYVTLCNDGRLTYHPSLHDYMEDVHGKEIPLQYVTVKVPGQWPRGSKAVGSSTANGVSETGFQIKEKRVMMGGYDPLRDCPRGNDDTLDNLSHPPPPTLGLGLISLANGTPGGETPNVKKRHRRMKSSSGARNNDCDDSDGYEFFIVSLDNKQWHFEAANSEDRDEWVAAIEQQILNSLQGIESSRSKSSSSCLADAETFKTIKTVPGNGHCCDCDSPHPDWASLNLGTLICIECSGIHRNLGSHVSKVRSLDLDDWTPGPVSVMLSVGNAVSNAVWESRIRGRAKPTPRSSREEKERWIRSKYERKEFVAPLPPGITSAHQQLIESVMLRDIPGVMLALAHAAGDDTGRPLGLPRDLRTPLHLAAQQASLPIVQLLLWHRASPSALDQDGHSALHYARNASCPEIANLLLKSGSADTGSSTLGNPSNTLTRRRGSIGARRNGGTNNNNNNNNPDMFDKLPASVI